MQITLTQVTPHVTAPLRFINNGSSPTCVHDNGSSIIDLTWSLADVCRLLTDWQVLSDAVSLSDHQYIAFRIGDTCGDHTSKCVHYPRWNTKTLDRDLFVEGAFRCTHNAHRLHRESFRCN